MYPCRIYPENHPNLESLVANFPAVNSIPDSWTTRFRHLLRLLAAREPEEARKEDFKKEAPKLMKKNKDLWLKAGLREPLEGEATAIAVSPVDAEDPRTPFLKSCNLMTRELSETKMTPRRAVVSRT
jgi:hypothetical protein